MIDTILSVAILLGVVVACLAARRRNSQRLAAAVSAAHASGYAEGGKAQAASMGNVTSVTVGGLASDNLADPAFVGAVSDAGLAILRAQVVAESLRRGIDGHVLDRPRGALDSLGSGAVFVHDDDDADDDDDDGVRSGGDDDDDTGAYDHGARAIGVVSAGNGSGLAGRRLTVTRPVRRAGGAGDRLVDPVGLDRGTA